MMEKRSPACFEKHYESCLSSLVRNFNSRLSRNPRKLISDKRHRSRKYLGISNSSTKLDLADYVKLGHEDTDDENGNEEILVTSGMASIRTLIEEEMSITLNPKVLNGEPDRVQSSWTNTANQTASPSINFDLATYMLEFYCENYHYQEKQADSNTKPCCAVEESHLIEKALADIADIFLCQKFIDPNLTTKEHSQSKEFIDALERLNSNKESFFKLIEDQKSLLLKHVEDLHGVSPKNVGRLTQYPFQKQNWKSLFFRKKYKLKEGRPSKGSDISAQLPQGGKHHKNMERLFSGFSFRKLKTRLRRVFGESRKSWHAISGPSVDTDTNDTHYKFQPLPIIKKKELGLPDSGESSLYEEAKKHLAELLASLDETVRLPEKEVSDQLQKPLPSPEHKNGLPHEETSFSENSTGHLCQLRQSSGDSETYSKGISEIFELSDIISIEEQDNSGVLTESNGSEPNYKNEKCGGEEPCTIVELWASDDKLEIPVPSASISCFLHIKESENLEEILENLERPGPVSVLEAVIPEDSLLPRSTTIDNHVDFHQESQNIHSEEHDNSDKEDIVGFVRTLLEASGLSCKETSEIWHSSDQLVDSSLFDKLASSFDLLTDDPDLLFDYINEVLAETRERLFGTTPWVSIIKPGMPIILTRNLIGEVCKGIDRHFRGKHFPYIQDECELDIWMDLELETDGVVMEMTHEILEEIMDRIVFELLT